MCCHFQKSIALQHSNFDFEHGIHLGCGSEGNVEKVKNLCDGQYYAVKTVVLGEKEDKINNSNNELLNMFNIDSPFIVKLYEAFYHEQTCKFIFEFMNCGSLGDVLNYTKGIPETSLCRIAEQVLHGLETLENLRIVHRDLKPENILVNSNGFIKIGDFGMSSKKTNMEWKTFKGTFTFMSPERLKGDSHSFSSDIWSLGMTLLTCFLGHFPFQMQEKTIWEMIEEIKKFNLEKYNISNELKDFLSKCLCFDASQRFTANKLLSHEWITKTKPISLKHWIYEAYISPRKTV